MAETQAGLRQPTGKEMNAPAGPSTSNGSTVSQSQRNIVYSKVPEQPCGTDEKEWTKFLASYRNGDWDSSTQCVGVVPKKARRVKLDNERSLDNHGTFALRATLLEYMHQPDNPPSLLLSLQSSF
jgi:hypothetical protein